MSLIEVRETAAEQAGSITAEFASAPVKEYTRSFWGRCDSPLDGPATILQALPGPGPSLLPVPGALYSTPGEIDLTAFCQSIEVDRINDDPYMWKITAKFSTTAVDGENNDIPESPDQVPPEVSVSFASYTKALTEDLDGKAIKNTLGDPFDPPFEVEDARPQISIVRNQLSFDLLTAMEYKDAINSDYVGPFKPGTCRMAGITADRVFDRGFYWRVTYVIEIRPEGWQPKILNHGFRYKSSGKIKNVTDDDGNFSNVAVLLDSNGQKIPPDIVEPTYLPFRVYEERNFGQLGLI